MGNWDVDKAMQTLVKYGFNCNDGNVLDYSRQILKSAVWLALDEQRELIDAAVDILCGEPCEYAISQSDVIDAIGSWMDSGENCLRGNAERYLIDRIKALPSVTPTKCIAKIEFDEKKLKEICDEAVQKVMADYGLRWIPLTEGEPEKEGEYLVTFDDGFVATVTYSETDTNGGMDWELWADSGEPIAWLPLPEPYKAESEGEE